ncbi:MAG: hypothetical protein ACOYUZ_01420 [Patescibacteria group bacterium]
MTEIKLTVVTAEGSAVVDMQEPGSIHQAAQVIMQAQVHSDLEDKPAEELSDEELLVRFLHRLAEKIALSTGELQNGGDSWSARKYGVDFKNDVFEMHPYWWGDCTCHVIDKEREFAAAHPHADNCYFQQHIEHMEFSEVGTYCDCDFLGQINAWAEVERLQHSPDCRTVVPNFRCGDIEIDWYKYIGRGMSISRPVTREELEAMFAKCFDSLK